MNFDQAYQILDYCVIPEKREDRIKLIRIMGYKRLRGGNLLPDCHDRQLRRVAERLFRKAEQEVRQYWDSVDETIRNEEMLENHQNSLYEMFNIPEEQRDSVTASELEARILK